MIAYNAHISQLEPHYTARGAEIVRGLLQISEADFTDEFSKIAKQIGKLALHSNAVQLAYGDPLLCKYIAGELGGSAGLWPHQLHTADAQFSSHHLAKYFDLVLSLLVELCN